MVMRFGQQSPIARNRIEALRSESEIIVAQVVQDWGKFTYSTPKHTLVPNPGFITSLPHGPVPEGTGP